MITERPLLKFSIFAAICVMFGLWLTSMIGNITWFEGQTEYQAVFDDVTGLVVNDEVRIAGVPVGRVVDAELHRGQALVTFKIRDDIVLPEATTVGVRWRGIVGLRFLYLYPQGEGELEAGHRFDSGSTFSPASIGVALERIVPIMRSLEPEVQNEFLHAMQEALVGQEEDIRRLVDEAAELTQTLAGREHEIARLLQNAGIVTQGLADRDDEIRAWLGNFVEAAEGIADRNDMLEQFISEVDDQQSEMRQFLETNSEGISLAIEALDEITFIIEQNIDDFEDVLKYSGHGIIPYHQMSRWGNYFLVRFLSTTSGEQAEQSDGRGQYLPPRENYSDTTTFRNNGDTEASNGSSMARFFLPAADGGAH
jgi:phospholipid/cholesterol/gamma-HCH transport system substrate-binding protein